MCVYQVGRKRGAKTLNIIFKQIKSICFSWGDLAPLNDQTEGLRVKIFCCIHPDFSIPEVRVACFSVTALTLAEQACSH